MTGIKDFTSHLFLKDTFDSFCFIEGEIITFNTFRIDGYIQKDFFDTDAQLPEYSFWKNLREYCFTLIRGKRTPLGFRFVFSLSHGNIARLIEQMVWAFVPRRYRAVYEHPVQRKCSDLCHRDFRLRHLPWTGRWNMHGMIW